MGVETSTFTRYLDFTKTSIYMDKIYMLRVYGPIKHRDIVPENQLVAPAYYNYQDAHADAENMRKCRFFSKVEVEEVELKGTPPAL